ncbi:exopolyphosphatase PRUNE1 isoform X2 [Rhinatrema bivittatum]|uniref:exopolyphosphatase PRUNE1 isoform X2 n=1 Tax=Rhinatrema bivittatum TaxID=194408 RepID=UPI00112E728C|nr:exopolyphosphatase PRUNE1 isoform X2 [Rhinatrema bivittatum]
MERFLQGCKAAVQCAERNSQEVHIVLGNEACDLDSAVSAIALAYYLAQTSSGMRPTFVPVLNTLRSEFPLRTECTFFLKARGIPEEHLVFRDEIDLHALHRAGLLSLTLVDHNVLPSGDEALEEAVTEVIDHRPLERRSSPSCKVTAELVGSCATLVTERILKEAPQVLDTQVASLLHGTIVLDCVNLAPEAGKVTPKDSECVALLESRFPDLPERSATFESLQKAKFDVSALTTDQMLRKDLKALSSDHVHLAICSIYINLEAFLQRKNLHQDLCAFCQRHGYNVLVAMTIAFNEKYEPFRQLAVYSEDKFLRESVCRALERAENPLLQLTPLPSPYSAIQAYDQGNTLASRKKALPILKHLLRSGELAGAMQQGAPESSDPQNKVGWEAKVHWSCGLRTSGAQAPEGCGSLDEAAAPAEEDELRGQEYSWRCVRRVDDPSPDEDILLPATPMNSLVEGCPLDRELPKLTAEVFLERFNQIAMTGSDTNSPDEGEP